MFDSGVKSMGDAIERIKNASDADAFNSAFRAVRAYMKEIGMNSESLMELERRAYYQRNLYSEKDTYERMEEAKSRGIS